MNLRKIASVLVAMVVMSVTGCFNGLDGMTRVPNCVNRGPEICNNGQDENCNGLTDEGCGGSCVYRSGEICGNGIDDDCNPQTSDTCSTPGGQCSPGATNAPDAYCSQTFCPNQGRVADHLTCASNGTWECICRNNSGGCSMTCAAGFYCNGTSCVPNGSNPGCTVTSANEICGNGIDDNCNGSYDEGCGGMMMPSSSCPAGQVRIDVTYTAPANAPAMNELAIWNPETHFVSPDGCRVTDGRRSLSCGWCQAEVEYRMVQVRLGFTSNFTYVDPESGVAAAASTNIWACTQGDRRTRFNDFGTTRISINGVYYGTAGGELGQIVRVDNGSLGGDGSRRWNGCNYGVIGQNPAPSRAQ